MGRVAEQHKEEEHFWMILLLPVFLIVSLAIVWIRGTNTRRERESVRRADEAYDRFLKRRNWK